MNRRTGLACLLLTVTVLSAGCGSAARPASAALASPALPPSLATSLDTTSGTWAVAVMGGPAASYNNFWQLFVRPAGTSTWRLVTPPGVASNGGLVVTSPGNGPVVAGFRPSQHLASSPLAITHDNGTAWTPAILDAGLADVPDALTAAPGSGRLLALLTGGQAKLSGPRGTAWTTLATHRALATSAAGSRCGLGSLTAAAFSPSGTPMLAGTCARRGMAGVFAYTGGTWHAAGLTLPTTYAHQVITVLRLTTTASTTTALLTAGTGPAARLLAAWSTGSSGHWAFAPPLPLNGAKVTSASPGPGGTVAIVLTGNHGETITGPASAWQALPALPPGTATLAPDPAGGWDALAVHSTRLTIWHAGPGAPTWSSTQTIHVPIQFGSSG